jgi:hypothetical protein
MADKQSHYSCPFINQHVKVPERIRVIINANLSGEYEDVRHFIGLIVVNLLALEEVAYSRNSNFYTEHGTRLYTRTSMKRAVDGAVRVGYAIRAREGYWNWEYGSGLSSTLAVGPRLAEFGEPVELELDIESIPLLAIDKRQVFGEAELTAIQNRVRAVEPESLSLFSRLKRAYGESLRLNRDYWNRMELGTGSLAKGTVYIREVSLTRVFKKGGVGRWFQRGGMSYQELSEDERAKLLIDGDEVAELDYHAMHPHLLYAWENQKCPDGFYEMITEKGGCTRDIAKSMTLFAVNAKDYAHLCSGINLDKAKEMKANRTRKQPKPILYNELKRLGLKPMDVIDAIREIRPAISKYVFSGSANRLMLEESDIMTAVLLRLMSQCIPALPIHDSVVFPKRHSETVKQVMEDEYRRQTGFEITVS